MEKGNLIIKIKSKIKVKKFIFKLNYLYVNKII
jgi:hypothetical protein